MGAVLLDDLEVLETCLNLTADVYNSIRDIINTLIYGVCAEPITELNYNGWNRLCGALHGAGYLFDAVEQRHKLIETALRQMESHIKANYGAEPPADQEDEEVWDIPGDALHTEDSEI